MEAEEIGMSRVGKKIQLNTSSKKVYFLLYTVLFAGMALCVFWPFLENDKSFIWVVDGWNQHFRALMYYKQWLLTIFDNLFVKHVLEIPMYSFSIGYGADILTTFNYYAIGDPLTVFAAFVPEEYMLFFYNGLVILRIYLAGMAFSLFCFYMKKTNIVAVLTGSMIYAFSGYAIFVVRHPFFLNAMIYLPLVLLGVEMLLRERKKWLLILSVFVSIISNFYFFYMIVCFTVLYVMVRLGIMVCNREGRDAFRALIQIGLNSLLGVLLGSFLFVPTAMAFLGDRRRGLKPYIPAFYSLEDYKGIIKGFTGFNYSSIYCILSFSALILLMIFVLYRCGKGREGLHLKILFPVMSMGLVFPFVGYALNGFSYVTCRFLFGYVMLVAYLVVFIWNDFIEISKGVMVQCLGVLGLYIALCITMGIWINDNMYASLLYAALSLGVFALLGVKKWNVKEQDCRVVKNGLVMVVLLGCVLLNDSQCNSSNAFSYHNSFVPNSKVYEDFYGDESYAVKKIIDGDEFARYTGDDITWNATIGNGTSSTQYFWSLSNAYVYDFLESIGNLDNSALSRYHSLDDRTVLNELVGVKYYVSKAGREGATVPVGYRFVTNADDKYDIYENENKLPFGYTYSKILNRKEYDELPIWDREAVMLQAAVVDEPIPELMDLDYQSDLAVCDYEIETESGIRIEENRFVVSAPGASMTIRFQGREEAETYLVWNGLTYSFDEENSGMEKNPEYEDISVGILATSAESSEKGAQKNLNIKTPFSRYYTAKEDFLVNLNYAKEERNQILVSFSREGIYSFAELHVVCNELKDYEQHVQERKEDSLESLDLHNRNRAYGTNLVTGNIDASKKELLVLNIPYAKGWSAYVDGEETEMIRSNLMFSAIDLEEGNHEIRLEYRTPGLRLGICISCVALMILIAVQVKKKAMGGRCR